MKAIEIFFKYISPFILGLIIGIVFTYQHCKNIHPVASHSVVISFPVTDSLKDGMRLHVQHITVDSIAIIK